MSLTEFHDFIVSIHIPNWRINPAENVLFILF